MKKIIALVLLLALGALALTSCQFLPGNNNDDKETINAVAEMYKNSQPTKVVVNTTHAISQTVTLLGSYELVVGEVDGKTAAIYKGEYDELRTIEDGSSQEIKDAVVTQKFTTDYIEGQGVRYNGGDWDPNGTSFIPSKGAIALNLDPSIMNNVKYENKKLTFTVNANSTETLFGADRGVNAPVTVEIVDDGALIVGVTIAYTIPADSAKNTGAIDVKIDALYFYDLEAINIE